MKFELLQDEELHLILRDAIDQYDYEQLIRVAVELLDRHVSPEDRPELSELLVAFSQRVLTPPNPREMIHRLIESQPALE